MWFKVSKASELSIELREYLKRCGLSERKVARCSGYVARQRGEYLPLTLEMFENVMRTKQWRGGVPMTEVIRQHSLRHLAEGCGVPEPIGELTSMYLKRCGYSVPEMEPWTSETKLLHDLGLCGDDILDDFSILQNEFGVDLSDFDFGKYFPNELSKEAYLVSMHRILCAIGLQKVANRIYKRRLARVCSKYPAVSLGMIESTIKRRKWIVEREQ